MFTFQKLPQRKIAIFEMQLPKPQRSAPIAALGSYRSGNCTFGKLPIGKIPLGKVPIAPIRCWFKVNCFNRNLEINLLSKKSVSNCCVVHWTISNHYLSLKFIFLYTTIFRVLLYWKMVSFIETIFLKFQSLVSLVEILLVLACSRSIFISSTTNNR